jgi:hypothetical protein
LGHWRAVTCIAPAHYSLRKAIIGSTFVWRMDGPTPARDESCRDAGGCLRARQWAGFVRGRDPADSRGLWRPALVRKCAVPRESQNVQIRKSDSPAWVFRRLREIREIFTTAVRDYFQAFLKTSASASCRNRSHAPNTAVCSWMRPRVSSPTVREGRFHQLHFDSTPALPYGRATNTMTTVRDAEISFPTLLEHLI